MGNVIKGVKVNGASYGIDYDSLANRPVYKDVTLGDFLLVETELTSLESKDSSRPFAIADVDIQEEIDAGDTFIMALDGVEYECRGYVQEEEDSMVYAVVAEYNTTPLYVEWYKTADGEWQTGTLNMIVSTAGDHTISIRRYTKELKLLDREFLGVYKMAIAPFTEIEKELGLPDLTGSILFANGSYSALITAAEPLDNGFISVFAGTNMNATYNPASGYLLTAESQGNTFDVTQTLDTDESYTSTSFVGSALVVGDGDPVIIYGTSKSGNVWSLNAAEQYLKDAEGNIVHDFSAGPVTVDVSTGEFTLNGTTDSSAENLM